MIVLDIETTGTDPKRHSIIEIGAIEFENPRNFFNEKCRIWPGAEIDPGALEINGFTIDEITDTSIITEKELLEKFNEWIGSIEERTIAGHNVDFDISFLNEGCKRSGVIHDYGRRKVDQHSLVYAHFLRRNSRPPVREGLSDLNSDVIMSYVGIPAEPKPHRALNGARYEMEAISRLIYGRSVFDEFSGYEIPEYLRSEQSGSFSGKL